MRKAANVAVNNYARLETDCKKQWNFHNSLGVHEIKKGGQNIAALL